MLLLSLLFFFPVSVERSLAKRKKKAGGGLGGSSPDALEHWMCMYVALLLVVASDALDLVWFGLVWFGWLVGLFVCLFVCLSRSFCLRLCVCLRLCDRSPSLCLSLSLCLSFAGARKTLLWC